VGLLTRPNGRTANTISIRSFAVGLAQSRRQARRRRSTLDPHGVILRTLAQQPLRAMDIGAAGGIADHWTDYLPVLEVDCFEPDAAECAARQRDSPANVHWFPVALAGSTGRRDFYVLNRATGSSLYPPNDAVILEYSGRSYAGVRRVIEVDSMSLRDFLVEYQRPVPHLLKLDTQGSEVEILSTLTAEQMQGLLCVEMEVEFLELYRGQPTFEDVHAFMQQRGYRLLDLRTHRSYRNGKDQARHYLRKYLRTAVGSSALSAELVAGDALYVRQSIVDGTLESTADLIASVCILRMYRFYDLAFWLIERAAHEAIISPSESTELARDVAYGAPRPSVAQRSGITGDIARRIRWVMARDDNEVFWTRRRWPDQ
jgi:FkbM family methyltransferase